MSSTSEASENEEPHMDMGRGTSFLLMQEELVEEHELQWDFPTKSFFQNAKSLRSGIDEGVTFKNGVLTNLDHTFGLRINKKVSETLSCAKFKLVVGGYDKKTKLFKLAGGRTQRIKLLKAQIDLYSKERKVIDVRFMKITEKDSTNAFIWTSGEEHFSSETEILRFRLLLRVEISDRGEGRVRKSCLDAPDMFLSEHLSDIRVVCSDGNKSVSYPAHRFVLSYNSPVLDRMLQSDMKEAKEGRIVIEDMSPTSLKELLRYMYTGEFLVSDESTLELYKVAHKYNIGTLKRQCRDGLLERLSTQNAVDIYLLGEIYECDWLKYNAYQFIKKCKNTIIEDDASLAEFYKKSPVLLLKLLQELC